MAWSSYANWNTAIHVLDVRSLGVVIVANEDFQTRRNEFIEFQSRL